MKRPSSDCLLDADSLQRRHESKYSLLQEAPRSRFNTADLHYKRVWSLEPRPSIQLALVVVTGMKLAKKFHGRARAVLLVGLFTFVETLRWMCFRRLKRLLSSAALRAPVARQGVKPLGRPTSDTGVGTNVEDAGGYALAQESLCQHLLAALSRNHRFDVHLRPHLLRRGLPDTASGWFAILYEVLSNSRTLHVRASVLVEAGKVAAACCRIEDGKQPTVGLPLWGLAATDCAWPRPLVLDAVFEASRALLSLGLRARGFCPRRVYVKIVNAELEYLLWIHPGPSHVTTVPVVFLHGVGAGAVLYGPLLSHLAAHRCVIAVEVPGASQGQLSEAGPAAVLDGLPAVIRIALGSQKLYDVVCHSAGGWWTSVVLRAAWRGVLESPRRVIILQSPCVVPAFLAIYLQGQGKNSESLPAPYAARRGFQSVLNKAFGRLAHSLFAKDLWNIHCMYVGFAADELVILPETIVPNSSTSVLFVFGEEDGYMDAHECVSYIQDMMSAPHINAVVLPRAGHGTFLLFNSEWTQTVSVVDTFLQRGSLS